jgi:hypothetical protein
VKYAMDKKEINNITENNNQTDTKDDLPFCTTAASAEHARAANEDEPCDDGRAGRIEEDIPNGSK